MDNLKSVLWLYPLVFLLGLAYRPGCFAASLREGIFTENYEGFKEYDRWRTALFALDDKLVEFKVARRKLEHTLAELPRAKEKTHPMDDDAVKDNAMSALKSAWDAIEHRKSTLHWLQEGDLNEANVFFRNAVEAEKQSATLQLRIINESGSLNGTPQDPYETEAYKTLFEEWEQLKDEAPTPAQLMFQLEELAKKRRDLEKNWEFFRHHRYSLPPFLKYRTLHMDLEAGALEIATREKQAVDAAFRAFEHEKAARISFQDHNLRRAVESLTRARNEQEKAILILQRWIIDDEGYFRAWSSHFYPSPTKQGVTTGGKVATLAAAVANRLPTTRSSLSDKFTHLRQMLRPNSSQKQMEMLEDATEKIN